MSQLHKERESQTRKEEEEYEMLDENDQVKYGLKILKNNQGIREMLITYRRYPLLHKGYGNYEELDVELKRWGKDVKVEIYLLRQSWNGTGYYPVCKTKLRGMDNRLFDINVNNENVKEVVTKLLKELRSPLENSECSNAVLFYFP